VTRCLRADAATARRRSRPVGVSLLLLRQYQTHTHDRILELRALS
jgi:hypothetical protein